jgi:ribosomal protein S18 acetylase RimI-like enzyme
MTGVDTVRIRVATPDDAADIAQIHVASWRVAYEDLMPESILKGLEVSKRTDSWRSILEQSELPCFIEVLGENPIGFAHISGSRDTDKEPSSVGEITAIYLDPAYWRRGFGTILINHAINALIDNGFSEVDLWVLEGHIMARHFYEKLGFIPNGKTKTHPKSGLSEVRYTKSTNEIRYPELPTPF